jgi:hypothetical protein
VWSDLACKPKCIAIDEEADRYIVHCRRFGKTYGAADKPLDPGPSIAMFALDCLYVLLANSVVLWVNGLLVRPPIHPCNIA